jgi:hypothetical protein
LPEKISIKREPGVGMATEAARLELKGALDWVCGDASVPADVLLRISFLLTTAGMVGWRLGRLYSDLSGRDLLAVLAAIESETERAILGDGEG